jgi:F-type H+-transporting ATPase subunit epsilon
MGVLPHHSPVLTTLKYGVIKVRRQGKEQIFAVSGGIAEIQPDIVTVLADAAEDVAEIDLARAEAAKRRAEEALAQTEHGNVDQILAIEAALRRSNLRIEVAQRYHQHADRGPKPQGEE